MWFVILSIVAMTTASPVCGSNPDNEETRTAWLRKYPTPANVKAIFPRVRDVSGYWQVRLDDLKEFGYTGAEAKGSEVRLVTSRVGRWHPRNGEYSVVILGLDVRIGCADGPAGFVVGVLDSKGNVVARSTEITSYGSQIGSSRTLDNHRHRPLSNQ